MDASYKIQRGIHVHLIQFFMRRGRVKIFSHFSLQALA